MASMLDDPYGRSMESESLPPPPLQRQPRMHPLDRPDDGVRAAADDGRALAMESARMKTAWAKLVWLLAFLAVLLAISHLVPRIAEQTQYAITRGKQRAEHDFAQEHLGESPIGEMSRAYQMVSQVVGPSVVHINTAGAEPRILPLRSEERRVGKECGAGWEAGQ